MSAPAFREFVRNRLYEELRSVVDNCAWCGKIVPAIDMQEHFGSTECSR